MRKSFQTFFPGAQWVGDGMQVAIEVNGERFVFNLELNVDAHAGALVGAHLGPTEDSEAVTEAFDDGVSATGEPPLALLLDNRESNHTDVVEAALGDQTLLIRSSPGRPQNKGHVEGAFGLFQQSAPPLVIEAQTERELAEAVLWLVTIVWGRTLNHKPRDDRKGRSRVDIYREEKPTQEQIDAAKKALESRRRKQEKAYKTRRARMNPVAREILDNAFSRLEFDDPDGNIKSAIARYPVDVIVSAIAIFEAKRNARTLPENAGPRYLLGIARNTAQRIEDRNLTDTLIRLRTETRDITLAPLIKETQQILQDHTAHRERIKALLRRAIDAEIFLDHRFWMGAVANTIAALPINEQIEAFRFAAARIRSAYCLSHQRRQDAIIFLAEKAGGEKIYIKIRRLRDF